MTAVVERADMTALHTERLSGTLPNDLLNRQLVAGLFGHVARSRTELRTFCCARRSLWQPAARHGRPFARMSAASSSCSHASRTRGGLGLPRVPKGVRDVAGQSRTHREKCRRKASGSVDRPGRKEELAP